MHTTPSFMKHTFTKISQSSLTELSDMFGSITALPAGFGSPIRKRLFTPSRTFWLFLSQICAQNCSCREVVKKFLIWLAQVHGTSASVKTTAYCQARKRLRRDDIVGIHETVVAQIESAPTEQTLWYDRPVKVVDGSSVALPDTPENQKKYPQPKGQKPGCGFPVMKIVALFSLGTGALLSWAYDSLHHHESTLFRRMWSLLSPGDVILADRGFCSYATVCCLLKNGVDSVLRNHQRRKVGQNRVKRLAQHDHLVRWQRPKQCPKWFPKKQWLTLPETITMREIELTVSVPGFRSKHIVVVTTLLDQALYPTEAFAELYLKRWRVELYLRDLKTSMCMECLRCKTPEMVEKELWMYGIAYNLIRSIMVQAALFAHQPLARISFKGTCATLRTWLPVMAASSSEIEPNGPLYMRMLAYIARDQNPDRFGRKEPRALKRRLKNYQLLTKHRSQFQEIPHRSKYKAA